MGNLTDWKEARQIMWDELEAQKNELTAKQVRLIETKTEEEFDNFLTELLLEDT